MNVLMIINPDTGEIVSYSLNWPDNEPSAPKAEENEAELPPSLKTYLVTDPQFYYKVREAREFLGDLKPVFGENGDLVDVQVTYPDLGEDR
jgi:hypothetical protein